MAILRRLGRAEQVKSVTDEVLSIDPLDFWAQNELALAEASSGNERSAAQIRARLSNLMRAETQSYLELATDYLKLGMLQEGIDLLRSVSTQEGTDPTNPLVLFYLGYLYHQQGNAVAADDAFRIGLRHGSDSRRVHPAGRLVAGNRPIYDQDVVVGGYVLHSQPRVPAALSLRMRRADNLAPVPVALLR